MKLYAKDPMGGGKGLSQFVQANLVQSLRQIKGAYTVLAFVGDEAVGLINCMPSFSTFNCMPLVNIHDVIVQKEYRGKQISSSMFALVEKRAIDLNCCKLTLEVLEGNVPAKLAYQKMGFSGYALDPLMGNALFWEKKLPQ